MKAKTKAKAKTHKNKITQRTSAHHNTPCLALLQQPQNLENFSHRVRIYGNVFLTYLSNILNNQNLTDAHTCYKLFKSQIFKNISLKEKDFSFCPEITTKLSLKKISIKEIPINYQGRTYSEGKKIVATDGFKAIKTLIKYRFFSHD